MVTRLFHILLLSATIESMSKGIRSPLIRFLVILLPVIAIPLLYAAFSNDRESFAPLVYGVFGGLFLIAYAIIEIIAGAFAGVTESKREQNQVTRMQLVTESVFAAILGGFAIRGVIVSNYPTQLYLVSGVGLLIVAALRFYASFYVYSINKPLGTSGPQQSKLIGVVAIITIGYLLYVYWI